MSPLTSLSLAISLFVFSILYSRYCFYRSLLSNTGASVLAGVGVGLGSGIFVYFDVIDGDLFGSIIAGVITAFVTGLIIFVLNQRLK